MPYYPGQWKVICDICGLEYYNTETKKMWNNLFACPDCWNERNPQDFRIRAKNERQVVRDARPEGADTPTVLETVAVTEIDATTAASGGNIPYDGGSAVTEYGVCWSTDHAPDTDDDRTSDGTGTGEFTSEITTLTASTKYYVRAYATNAAGTSYGPEIEFTTTS